jgi:hypothetical protein
MNVTSKVFENNGLTPTPVGSRMFSEKSIEEARATPDIPMQTAMATKQQNLFIFPAPFS